MNSQYLWYNNDIRTFVVDFYPYRGLGDNFFIQYPDGWNWNNTIVLSASTWRVGDTYEDDEYDIHPSGYQSAQEVNGWGVRNLYNNQSNTRSTCLYTNPYVEVREYNIMVNVFNPNGLLFDNTTSTQTEDDVYDQQGNRKKDRFRVRITIMKVNNIREYENIQSMENISWNSENVEE